MGKEEKKAWVRTAAAKATVRTTKEKNMAVTSKVTVVVWRVGLLPKSLSPEERVYEPDTAHEGSGRNGFQTNSIEDVKLQDHDDWEPLEHCTSRTL